MAENKREFKTGENVSEEGKYVNTSKQRQSFKQGDVFPSCPKSGTETSWRLDI